MNCRNCGMPLTGPKCEYCGTDYSGVYVGGIITPKPYTFDRDKFIKALDAEPCILFANEEPIAIYYDGVVWDADGIQTTPLNDTKLTASSAWRWNT